MTTAQQRREYYRRFYARHRERIKAEKLAAYYANTYKAMDRARVWRKRNAEQISAYNRKYNRRYYDRYRARILERKSAAYRADPQKMSDRNRAWKRLNPQKVRAMRRRYRQANPEKMASRERRYRQKYPDKVRARRQRRRARLKAVLIENFTTAEIFARDKGRCGICKRSVERKEATLDHIVPLSRGGPHTRANVQIAHRSCNCRKGVRLLRRRAA